MAELKRVVCSYSSCLDVLSLSQLHWKIIVIRTVIDGICVAYITRDFGPNDEPTASLIWRKTHPFQSWRQWCFAAISTKCSAYAATISGTTNSVITYSEPRADIVGDRLIAHHHLGTNPKFHRFGDDQHGIFCEVPLPLGSARVVNISQHYFSGWDPSYPRRCTGFETIIFDLSEHVAIRDFQNDESILSIISTSNTEFHVLGLTTLNVFFMRSPTDLTFPFFLPVRTQSYKLDHLGLRPVLDPHALPGLFVSVEGASGIPDGEYPADPRTDNTTLISMQTAEINRGLSGALAEFAYAVYHQ
ncbi:hypothetical protein PAPYR_13124 [Paratrimastix pyriformis]|uniref:Uncharacterized protein n=1 Tax=Paratrimastix pyriformis TaxID=342808 RepID=A0ABQ8U0T0_9EUKA|nr:hypothetical protein PAPYR_13124 [Paratrimastix pyriformis]